MKNKIWIIFAAIVVAGYCGKVAVAVEEETSRIYSEENIIEETLTKDESEDFFEQTVGDAGYVFGEVEAVNDKSIKLKQEELNPETDEEISKEREVFYDGETMIEGAASIESLAKGTNVYVEYVKKDNKNQAIYISVEN